MSFLFFLLSMVGFFAAGYALARITGSLVEGWEREDTGFKDRLRDMRAFLRDESTWADVGRRVRNLFRALKPGGRGSKP